MNRNAADSPWFWVLIFAASALAALTVIGPKHLRRQERLDRMADQRARQQADVDSPAPMVEIDDSSSPTSLRWMQGLLVAVIIVSVVVLVRQRRSPAS